VRFLRWKHLVALGLAAAIDRALLACWCEAWAEWVDLVAAVDEVETYAEAIKLGLLNAKARAREELLKLAQQFGFSPSARARVHANDQGEEQADPFEAFLTRRPGRKA